MSGMKDGCVKAARGPIVPTPGAAAQEPKVEPSQEDQSMLARVGKEAIDFEANAFIAGAGFKPVRLSSYKGQWIVVCFYPGDFTFV